MTTILKAKEIVDLQTEKIKSQIAKLSFSPKLKVILIGNNPNSKIYVKRKKEFCEKIGAKCEIIERDQNFSPDELKKLLSEINRDPNTHGCLVQLPLPSQFKGFDFQHLISPDKDVDGFHQRNIFSIYQNQRGNFLLPCTPLGIITMLEHFNIEVSGKNICVIGRSLIVGKPLSMMLSNLDATVTLCHSKTKDLQSITRSSDIVISAVGSPKFLTGSYFNKSKNQTVIDVGISRLSSGQLCGDVDFEHVKPIVNAITPVPGGIGPMTILSLAKNLLKAAQNSN